MQLTTAQKTAIDQDNRQMSLLGFPLSQVVQDMLDDIAAGNIGVTALAGDVDSLAKGGESFARDPDNDSGLTFAYKSGRFHNGLALVTVSTGTIALSASSTNYIEVDRSGAVSTNTSAFTSGRMPLYIVVTGSGDFDEADVTSKKPIMTLVGAAGTVGAMLSTNAKTKSIEVPLGDIAATAAFSIILPPHIAKITGVTFATKTAVTANDTNYWTFSAINKGASGSGTTDVLDTGAANTTKATGGTGTTGYVKRNLTLHGTAANLDTAAGDVVEVTITKTASATTMQQCSLRVDYTFED